ncbi:hypothetical protein G0A00_17605 [Yangia sp. PrR002]|nr:hypothetical protein [Salipiger sp. PrR002]NDW57919.1 hypothetical protein [Salipiger sp. PrR004]
MTSVFAKDFARRLRDEDEGLALTEYLVVLGLMIGGVIFAVMLFGLNLNLAWSQWADWLADSLYVDGSTVTAATTTEPTAPTQ